MTSMPRVFIFHFNFLHRFGSLCIVSHNLNLDSSRWFREDVQWILDSLHRKAYGLNGFHTFSHSTGFFLLLFVAVFIRLFVMSDCDLKLLFVICKSVSAMTGTRSNLQQPKLICEQSIFFFF